MALSFAKVKEGSLGGGLKFEISDVTIGVYATNGLLVPASQLTIANILGARALGGNAGSGAYEAHYDTANKKLMMFRSAGLTPAGTVAAPTFTGTAPISSLNLATPAFSGTGLTAAGQVMTTTDNQTMTLNQCAGMWLIPATGATPPMLILSNTAVTGAPAVLTVQGAAATDAGAYKIVKSLTPIGTNSAPAFTGTAIAAGGLAEVANAVSLTTIVVRMLFIGF